MIVRLAPNQIALWLADRTASREATYNVVAAYRVNGVMDDDLLGARFAAVVRAHPLLRARVIETDGGLGFADGPLPVLEVESLPYRADDDRAGAGSWARPGAPYP